MFTCNFLPRGLELVGPGVVPVDVNGTEEELLVKASAQHGSPGLRCDKARRVVVAVLPDLSTSRVGALVHLQLVAAVNLTRAGWAKI